MDRVEQEVKTPWAMIAFTTLMMVILGAGIYADRWSEKASSCFARGGEKYDSLSGKCFKVEHIP